MSETSVITYQSEDGSGDSFRIDDIGIDLVRPIGLGLVRRGLLEWTKVQTVYAWVTTGDGNWGFDEFYHIKFHYKDGSKLYVSDSDSQKSKLFWALWDSLTRFLLGVSEQWKEEVLADYQRRLKGPSSWLLYAWYPNKPVIYRC